MYSNEYIIIKTCVSHRTSKEWGLFCCFENHCTASTKLQNKQRLRNFLPTDDDCYSQADDCLFSHLYFQKGEKFIDS